MIPFISITTDFGVQSQGVGTMEATIFKLAPETKVIHLMHGVSAFDTRAAARTLESVNYFPIGFHICVCDPGVGTARKAIAIRVARGDTLIGPDNGVLIPASRMLGGITKVVELADDRYHLKPVSPIFHGRDIFASCAAHLSRGVPLEKFGPELPSQGLAKAAYEEGYVKDGALHGEILQINRFGSVHLNITHELWDSCHFPAGQKVEVQCDGKPAFYPLYVRTFGEVAPGGNVILRDDFGRVEMAKNLGSLISEFPMAIGDKVLIALPG